MSQLLSTYRAYTSAPTYTPTHPPIHRPPYSHPLQDAARIALKASGYDTNLAAEFCVTGIPSGRQLPPSPRPTSAAPSGRQSKNLIGNNVVPAKSATSSSKPWQKRAGQGDAYGMYSTTGSGQETGGFSNTGGMSVGGGRTAPTSHHYGGGGGEGRGASSVAEYHPEPKRVAGAGGARFDRKITPRAPEVGATAVSARVGGGGTVDV